MTKTIQLGECLSNMGSGFANLSKSSGKKAIADLAVPLTKEVLSGQVSNMALNITLKAVNKLGNKLT